MKPVPLLLLAAVALLAGASSACLEPEEPVVLYPAPAPRPVRLAPVAAQPLAVSAFPPSAATVCEGAVDAVGRMRAQVYSLPLETRQLP
ncbi:MAG TPA: hypothetical protein VIF09_22005, partial [Polyangiaceae bacterium]